MARTQRNQQAGKIQAMICLSAEVSLHGPGAEEQLAAIIGSAGSN